MDFLKFLFYTSFFSFLFFFSEKAISPEWQLFLNSADNKEIKNDTSDTVFSIWKKEENKPSFTIQLNPDNIKIDDIYIKSLKANIESKYLKWKVTPIAITIDKTRKDPRWQVTGNKLIISWYMENNLSEAVKVFVHELWHIVDLHFLSMVWDYDPSENFYNISWLSYNVKKKNAKLTDFVSWYALTNKYEDFAESFSFYVFHNEEFKRRALSNIVISRKYNFFKKYLFIDSEFQNTSFESSKIASYNWDSTKIAINFKKYLYYIR